MNSQVLRRILQCLETRKYPHLLNWSNSDKKEFEVVFVHKKNPDWESSYLDLCKDLDSISDTKFKKYSQQKNYCTESKGRIRANLLRLCKNGHISFLKEVIEKSAKIKVFKLNFPVKNIPLFLQDTPKKKKKSHKPKVIFPLATPIIFHRNSNSCRNSDSLGQELHIASEELSTPTFPNAVKEQPTNISLEALVMPPCFVVTNSEGQIDIQSCMVDSTMPSISPPTDLQSPISVQENNKPEQVVPNFSHIDVASLTQPEFESICGSQSIPTLPDVNVEMSAYDEEKIAPCSSYNVPMISITQNDANENEMLTLASSFNEGRSPDSGYDSLEEDWNQWYKNLAEFDYFLNEAGNMATEDGRSSMDTNVLHLDSEDIQKLVDNDLDPMCLYK